MLRCEEGGDYLCQHGLQLLKLPGTRIACGQKPVWRLLLSALLLFLLSATIFSGILLVVLLADLRACSALLGALGLS